MKENKIEETSEDENSEDEDYLDKIWENWASRRRCEKRHLPKFIEKNHEKKRINL